MTPHNLALHVFRNRPSLPAAPLILLSALWIAIVDNGVLWRTLFSRLDVISFQGSGYALTLLSILVLLFSIPIMLLGQRVLLKPIIAMLLVTSGSLAYFTAELGIIFDKEMVRNLVHTVRDQNTQEGFELISGALLSSLAVTTLIPLALILWVKVRRNGFLLDNVWRLGYAIVLTGLVSALILANFKSVTYVSRQNRDLESVITPWYAFKSLDKLYSDTVKTQNKPFVILGDDAVQQPRGEGRRVGIMVVGETARADHFTLNGYERNTNPELAQRDIINFTDVQSCGTSTAFSVPCMFSFLTLDTYSPEKAASESNVLDVLSTAGIDVFWIDSNSSCKGVCNRIPSINVMDNPPDTDSPLYVDGAYQDEYLLSQVDKYLDQNVRDLLLVLHTMGSHGPAYYRRYPGAKGPFQPACRSKAPQDCPNSEIVNAYDNTIHYTDRFLASIIDKLTATGGQKFMFYASDHGESLGENGIYLHGLPRSIAPDAQRQVPMLAWFSDELALKTGDLSAHRGVRQDTRKLSHDVISASLLGLYGVNTEVYRPDLDVFSTPPIGYKQATFR